MEYLRRPRDRPRKPDGGRCRKHPRHRQSPGVCSLCLREKLSQLSSGGSTTSSSSYRIVDGAGDSSCSSSSSSSVSPYDDESSSTGSSPASPVHRRYVFDKSRSSGLFGWNKDVLLTKSRSVVAFVPSGKGKKGIGGSFWSKLIPGRGRKTGSGEGLKHSKTMRERPLQ